MTDEEDGSLTVRFRAGGLREICWHLFTWGDTVTIVAPAALREMLRVASQGHGFNHESAGELGGKAG